jgi:UDP-glucuronate decarboxylase
MKVFVTGGAGFIGSHLTERLIAEGHTVHIFDNLHRNAIKYSDILTHPNVTFTQGDILDKESLKNAMSGSEMVFHMAAIAGVSNYYNFPAKTLKVNLIGTYNVLECMTELNIKRIFDMSTSETFGTDAVEVDEESYQRIGPPQDKRWCYAGSKIGGEQLIFRYAEEYHWSATVIRPFNVYGPRQIGEGAIANFCKNILEKKDLRIEGSGMAIRSWCYITDFVDALMAVFNKSHTGPECFNVGNPWAVATTVSLGEEVLRASERLEGNKPSSRIDFVPMDFTEIRVRYPKVNKLRDWYGWQPKVNLAEGVFNTLKWYKENYEKN